MVQVERKYIFRNLNVCYEFVHASYRLHTNSLSDDDDGYDDDDDENRTSI